MALYSSFFPGQEGDAGGAYVQDVGVAKTISSTDPLGDGSLDAKYELNNDSTDTTGSYDGTATGITYASGVYEEGAVFDGVASNNIIASTTISGNDARTVCFWEKGTTEDNIVVSFSASSTDNESWAINLRANAIDIYGHGGANDQTLLSAPSIRDGEWHHMAVMWDGIQTLSVYVDGILTEARTFVHTYATASTFRMNSWADANRPYTGMLDQVQVFTKALSALEVNEIYYEATAQEIQNYTTRLNNTSVGATALKTKTDGSGRPTGTALAGTTQWKDDGRTAPTGWTIAPPYTITEDIDGDEYTFTSDLNRYKNDIADGTFTAPTGVWTLDGFGFDGVTPVTARGVTHMLEEIKVP